MPSEPPPQNVQRAPMDRPGARNKPLMKPYDVDDLSMTRDFQNSNLRPRSSRPAPEREYHGGVVQRDSARLQADAPLAGWVEHGRWGILAEENEKKRERESLSNAPNSTG